MRHSEPQRRPPTGLIASAVLAVVGLILVLILIGVYVVMLVAAAHPLLVDWLGIAAAVGLVAVVLATPTIGLLTVYRRWASHRYIQEHHTTQQIRARVQVAPLATSFNYRPEPNIIDQAAPALPAPPIDVIKPMADWMPWIDEQPHALLGGKTKAGKTWLATALLERRIDDGTDIFIIDPHSSDWLGLPTAGGSGIPERRDALKAVLSEYLRRMAQREEHKRRTGHELPHDYFDPLVVVVDEANAMLEELAAEWKTVLKQVASGSRKVGISLLLLAQSPLVEDLGISGAMRENFSRIALDDRTVQALIDSERDRDRKQALHAAFRAMDRPAAAQIGAQTWLLDRRGLSPGNASAGARIWAGWDFDNACAVSGVSAQKADDGSLSNQLLLDDDVAGAVISPGANVAPVAAVALDAAEIANIAGLLASLPTSEVVKKVDGYNGRNYREIKAKVEAVKQLMGGQQ